MLLHPTANLQSQKIGIWPISKYVIRKYEIQTEWVTDWAAPPEGVGGTTYPSPPPLLRPVPRRGYNAIYIVGLHLRGTTAGRGAKVTQFAFGFSTWKFCFQFATTMTLKI